MRLISLAFLVNAMRRIKRVIQTNLTQMPNLRIMIAFIFAFLLFALSTVGIVSGIIRQEVLPTPRPRSARW